MTQWFNSLADLMLQGGFVMYPLVLGAALMSYYLGLRWSLLRAPKDFRASDILKTSTTLKSQKNQLSLIEIAGIEMIKTAKENSFLTTSALKEKLEIISRACQKEFKKGALVCDCIVYTAPLLGLLGTVSGMIETFDSLADMSLFSQSGGIAGGISQALVSTQMGLIVAVPGLLLSRSLSQTQKLRYEQLEQIQSLAIEQAKGASL